MKKGKLWIVEILVFVAVFLVSQIAMSIILVPVTFISLFADGNFSGAVLNGDVNAILEIEEKIMSSNIYLIAMLVSEILMIVIVCFFCKILQKRKMSTLGFVKKGMVKEYLIGMLAGFICFSLAVLLSVATGSIQLERSSSFLVHPSKVIGIFIAFLVGYMIQGMAEEVLCRGYFLVSYARRYPMYAAIVANALAFAALHLLNSGISVLAFVNLFLFGVFASVYFIRRGNIWGIAAFHSVWNLVQGNLYGIKVSGNSTGDSFLTAISLEGKELFNGGSFGLEGSISVTVVLLVGTLFLYFWRREKSID